MKIFLRIFGVYFEKKINQIMLKYQTTTDLIRKRIIWNLLNFKNIFLLLRLLIVIIIFIYITNLSLSLSTTFQLFLISNFSYYTNVQNVVDGEWIFHTNNSSRKWSCKRFLISCDITKQRNHRASSSSLFKAHAALIDIIE